VGDLENTLAAREEELERLCRENAALHTQIEVLAELSQTILTSPDLQTIGDCVLDACMSLSAFDVAYIYLYDPAADFLTPLGARGMQHPELLKPRRHNVVEVSGMDGRTVVRGRYFPLVSHQPMVLDDVQARDGYRTMKAEGVHAALFVPLTAQDDILGVLQLGSRTPRQFEPGAVRLMETVGRQMGIAVQKARAYEETSRAYAEQQAGEEASERLVAILEATTDFVGIMSADRIPVYLNRAARRVLGIGQDADPSDHALGTNKPEWARERLLNEAIPAAIRDGSWVGETVFLAPDGSEIPFSQLLIAHRDSEGRLQFLSTIARDITEQKEAERQSEALAQTEKLRALGQMAGGIAHDLNQCLALVAGHAELAIRNLDRDAGPETIRVSLRTVLRSARDGAQSVKRLQTYARPAQSDTPIKLDLGALVTEVANLTAPAWRDRAQEEGRRVELRVRADGDTTIEGSAPDLREGLTNLVLNAVDALPQGGTIDLRVQRRRQRVHVEVQDSGVGMPPEVRAKIFEPFFTTKGEKGLGLGLSMVFGVVQRHDGTVEVDSTPGAGTTFRLSFPAAGGEADNAETLEGLAPIRTLRILAVDDDWEIANMVSLMLEPFGHEIAVATSGEEALERLAADRYDLVISDVGMGARMNGWELASRVKAGFPGVRLVLATGWGAEIDPEDARTRGVDAVVSKPFRIADLTRVVSGL
jgi:PAS domain S-box-containing protein